MVNRRRVAGTSGSCLLIKDKRGILQANDYVSSILASLYHDAVVEPFVRLGPGCHVAGHVIVGRGTTVGIGPTIIEELVIDSGAVGADGSVVINDIEAGAWVAAVPAIAKPRPDGDGT